MCKENAVFNLSRVIHNQINNDDLKTFYIDFAEIAKSENEFIELLFDALVEFTFGIDAINILSSQDIERFIDACEILYKGNRETKKEGDLGEVILHALLRDYLETLPFTGKIHFINDTGTPAKGFDIVHITKDCKNLILGESKMYGPFYKKGVLQEGIVVAKKALDNLADDIRTHFTIDYMKTKFILIEQKTKVDNIEVQIKMVNPVRDKLKEFKNILRKCKSIDELIDDIYVPLLCTYSSTLYNIKNQTLQVFIEDYSKEMECLEQYFKNKNIAVPQNLNIVLMFFPIPDKDRLIQKYYDKLKEINGK